MVSLALSIPRVARRPPSLEDYDRRIDTAVDEPFRAPTPAPSTLYHYTDWTAFEGILQQRAFRATCHRYTNDPQELRAVDEIALAVAAAMRRSASPACQKVMTAFLDLHPTKRPYDVVSIYLACFSSARDESIHWDLYAAGGNGVCMGLRLLSSEDYPAEPPMGRSLKMVDYDPASLEAKIRRGFANVAKEFDAYLGSSPEIADQTKAFRLTVVALARVTGMAALAAKEPRWSGEKEWRQTAIWRFGQQRPPQICVRSDGTEAEFVLLPMRQPGQLLILDELIVGPLEDFELASARANEILRAAGYPSGDAHVPPILRSKFSRR